MSLFLPLQYQRVTDLTEFIDMLAKGGSPRGVTKMTFPLVLVIRSLETHSADDSNMEYTKQLLLSCLLNVCHKVAPEGGATAAGGFSNFASTVQEVVTL